MEYNILLINAENSRKKLANCKELTYVTGHLATLLIRHTFDTHITFILLKVLVSSYGMADQMREI